MISLIFGEDRTVNILINENGAKMLVDVLAGYLGKTVNDHDHIHFSDGLISDNKLDGFEFEQSQMADEIVFRFRPDLKLK